MLLFCKHYFNVFNDGRYCEEVFVEGYIDEQGVITIKELKDMLEQDNKYGYQTIFEQQFTKDEMDDFIIKLILENASSERIKIYQYAQTCFKS